MTIRRQQGKRPEKGNLWNYKAKIANTHLCKLLALVDTLGLWEQAPADLTGSDGERPVALTGAAFGSAENSPNSWLQYFCSHWG